MDEVMIFWMVLLILCIGIEVLTLGLTTIWFAAGALVAIFAALLYAPIFVQVILFLLVSLLSLFFTRPIAVKYFNRDRVKTNVESMVGRQAIVTGEIDNLQAAGQVTVSGQEWSARSWDDKVKIPAGAVVVVTAISGVKLIVRPDQKLDDRETAGQETSRFRGNEDVRTAERLAEASEADRQEEKSPMEMLRGPEEHKPEEMPAEPEEQKSMEMRAEPEEQKPEKMQTGPQE